MSDEMFEVAFSGQIVDGADLAQVKAKVGQMFKADEAKLVHLFSGKRVVIKKNIDQQTAAKYESALSKVGAVCEVKNLSAPITESIEVTAVPVADPEEPTVATSTNIKVTVPDVPVSAPLAPDTDPLHISAGDIEEISMTVAPVGSDMQDEIKAAAEPELDISGLDMAPVGADMSDKKEEDVPPPPDTEGLKIVD